MKKNLSIFGLLAAILLTFNISSASADPTYAVLDANGNVTNIIVCGSACASGEFGGNKVVLQVAADPVTGENRGGFWQGPETTTYNDSTKVFTITQNPGVTVASDSVVEYLSNTNIINTETITTVEDDGTEISTIVNTKQVDNITTKSSAVIIGELLSIQFKYEDTVGDNLFTRHGFIKNWSDNSQATVAVNIDQTITTATVSNNIETISSIVTQNSLESVSFDSRKTAQEVQDSIINSNLSLLNSKIQTLISLLGSWTK
jgi:hypothetical protein